MAIGKISEQLQVPEANFDKCVRLGHFRHLGSIVSTDLSNTADIYLQIMLLFVCLFVCVRFYSDTTATPIFLIPGSFDS